MRRVIVTAAAIVAGVVPGALVSPAAADPGPTDLSASISATANPDGTVSVSAAINNPGPNDARQVILTVPLPAGLAMTPTPPTGPCAFDPSSDAVVCSSVWDGADHPLPPGSAPTQFKLVACTAVSDVSISATVSSPDDTNGSNNSATSAPFTPASTAACADMGIRMSGPTSDVVAGAAFNYTITVGNLGPNSAGQTTVTDVVPSGLTVTSVSPPLTTSGGVTSGCSYTGQKVTCSGPGLDPPTPPNPGPTVTITITAVAGSTSTTENLTNTATLSSVTPDASQANNVASVPTTVDPSASGTVAPGGTVSTGTNATADAPVQTAVMLPGGGTVTIAETTPSTPVPSSYTLLGGTEVTITSSYSSTTSPLTITFYIDGPTLTAANLTYQDVAISRNGVVLGNCDTNPIPCVSRSFDAITNDAVITVTTDHASTWDVLQPSQPPYDFQGFYSPIKNWPAVNTATAGTVVPVKFSVGQQAPAGFADEKYGQTDCATFGPPASFNAAPGSLAYNASTGRYTFSWQTAKAQAGTCVRFVLTLNDGTTHTANVKLTK